MSSGRRKFVVRQPVVVDIGCSCRRPKLPSFFSSSPKPKPSKSSIPLSPSTTTSHWETSLTAANSSSSFSSRCGDYTSSPSPPFYPPESPKRTTPRGQRKASKNKTKNKCGPSAAAAAAARKGVVEGSMAVVKESSDPYVDFRDSMLQMIVEMEIYAWEDLRDLLHRFLDLNSPRHHLLILRAFAEIWNGIFWLPSPSPSSPPSSPAAPASASNSAIPRRRR